MSSTSVTFYNYTFCEARINYTHGANESDEIAITIPPKSYQVVTVNDTTLNYYAFVKTQQWCSSTTGNFSNTIAGLIDGYKVLLGAYSDVPGSTHITAFTEVGCVDLTSLVSQSSGYYVMGIILVDICNNDNKTYVVPEPAGTSGALYTDCPPCSPCPTNPDCPICPTNPDCPDCPDCPTVPDSTGMSTKNKVLLGLSGIAIVAIITVIAIFMYKASKKNKAIDSSTPADGSSAPADGSSTPDA